jgi:DNA polymerase I
MKGVPGLYARLKPVKDTFLIVDGNSVMHRAFHALPLLDTGGIYTNAVLGFLSMLLRVIDEEAPRYCVVAFDEHGPTFRHTVYPEYKAGRASTPEELRSQFPLIREILAEMHVGVTSVAGYEADDILGTMAFRCREQGIGALLLTGDRDALQLVGDGVELIFMRKGITETTRFRAEVVKEVFGVRPEQVTDWKGLMGDSSDNIPGVPGVGEKTAVKLLDEYKTLDNILEHADEIKGKLGEKLRENKELARFSRELATIRTTVPLEIKFSECDTSRLAEGVPALRKYQLNSIASRLLKQAKPAAAPMLASTEPAQEWEELHTAEDIASFICSTQGMRTALHITEDALTLAVPDRRARIMLLAQKDLFSAPSGLDSNVALKHLSPLFSRPLHVHDGKRLLHILDMLKLPLPCFEWDTMLAAYLHNPQERSYALAAFTADNASGLLDLALTQERQLTEEGMIALYRDIELPLLYVLFDMERIGFRVDEKVLEELGKSFSARAETLKEEIYSLTGVRGFNLNSPQQLGKVLFDTLKLPVGRKTQTGYSTDADTLEWISDSHPAIPLILLYRQIVKLNSTYIDALLGKMDINGRVHTTFDQAATATGRISSVEPNLQNIPVRSDIGRDIRRAFIPEAGWALADADYSQIELRILAHFSGDPAMRDAFRLGEDIHTRTAAAVEGVPVQRVTPEMRSRAKAVNFGIVYGISDFGLARNIGISRPEAKKFIDRYFVQYPGVRTFMDNAVRDGKTKGYATTLQGRRRQLPELKSNNANTRNFGERIAMNTPIQGTAADIIKQAMVKVHDGLKNGGFKARLILQVHDELIIETPADEIERVRDLLKDCMENVAVLTVPLTAEVKVGANWYETK